ncbi:MULTISPECIES: GNAT family N-acetyltransferase [unclassified Agarivorans]|uniref:GNAT family N-acetyltransferase n=1 Tax=unclassified Agarivorans TaxID=2636026 RepID=UPI0026E14918|nr:MULTISPECIES: GNAT family N-acetyltransferase [unclassified Agarivorans]MDO6688088.1 GNAT family N-acetyltransferase [Agarivorans sp. 3_MG-2023]MDO6717683.1 GNAT family N-acetyltransferase [Agarivorans sp. 2_MG-2023]
MTLFPISTSQDIQTVAALAREIWLEHFTPIIGKDQVEYMLANYHSLDRISEQIKSENYHYYLLQHNGGNAGYLGIQLTGSGLFLSKLYVRHSARGLGVGKAAMAFAQQFAKDNGASNVNLTVNRHNHDSIAAYLKMGFVKVREECADIGQGYVMDDWIMELNIKP